VHAAMVERVLSDSVLSDSIATHRVR
jgi:hypothetical protein